ncbi:MAG: DPP IV N-terminal domain-containing protein [Duncaniella sp.]|uniref:S41 family peptidase n=1 Tax=Duncaniella sp. TaxID=2518496 RepID=UPI0023BB7DFE|nr:S41 family peptidase [Duncaniella sp.]MDE5989187.1 DPP IV N-terminal domain-containing protein [Duncaniella sp.]
MRKSIISLALFAIGSLGMSAAPLWLRNVAISPDGTTIAFTYKGNIFTVPAKGGDARQLTSGGSYNTLPVWSPDGSKIAFNSDREGSLDIFVVDSKGGVPKRLTTHSGNETPLAFKDNSHVVFSTADMPASTAAQAAFSQQVYTVDINGGRPEMMISLTMPALSFNRDGRVLYQDRKGVENIWRKHERSSGTADIWLLDNGKHTKLTDFNGHDMNPVWANDGQFYFISEEDGTLNVYKRSVDGSQKRQLTKFKTHPVRSLSASDNGRLAFSWNGEIYTMTENEKPSKVEVNILSDDYASPVEKTMRRSGASTFAVSPDGELVAFVLRGDVYVTSTEYNTTRRITDTPAQERAVDFAPDGRSIVYDSERDGIWQLFTTEIKDPEEKSLLYATELVEKPLYKSDKPAFFPAYSPDGKKVAFLEDRTTLRVMDLKSKKVVTALDGKYNYSYADGDAGFEWSPDSRWLLTNYIGIGGWNNADIALVKADGSETVNLTESGYSNGSPQWVLGGKAVAYTTSKYGYKSHGSWGNESDVMLMFLDGEAYDRFRMTDEELKLADKEKSAKDKKKQDGKKSDSKKKSKKDAAKKNDAKKDSVKKDEVKALDLDFENRRYRMARLTGSSARLGSYYISPKGDKLYYVASSPDGRSLYERNLKEGGTRVLVKGLSAWGMVPDKKGANIFVIDRSGIKKVNLASGKSTGVSYEAEYNRRPSEEREYIYDHMWRQVFDKFHDKKFHGADWKLYKKEYARFLPHINNGYDFAILLSEILGELNASHTGGIYSGGSGRQVLPTASFGAFFDESFKGDGLKIKEIVKRGPLSDKSLGLAAGDVILSVNDSLIRAGKDYYPLLEGKNGKKVKLEVKKAKGEKKTVYVKPVGSNTIKDLLYSRWVERNERIVDSVSGGRIAYVHVKAMDGSSFNEVYDRLLGKYRNHDAVVVDTRHNGGGWLHNDLAILLSGKAYVTHCPRGQFIGTDPFSQWCKPSAMLVDESNYSDAHGTPYVYQTLKIGDVIGAPIPGTMTAVWWETQIDPTIVFGIPEVTSLDRNGEMLENKQLNPDVVIYNNPADVLRGVDEQLIGATKHLMKKTAKK